MWEGSEQTVIAASLEVIWAIVTDVAQHPKLAGSGEIGAIRLHGPVVAGSTWEADIKVPGLDDPFVARSRVVVFIAPHEFSWTSEPRPVIPGEPDSVPLVTWWFRLSQQAEGTLVEHVFRVDDPKVGAEDLAEFFETTDRVSSIRAGMQQTLANLKAAAEGASGAAGSYV